MTTRPRPGNHRIAPTLEEVAARAGVSRATASRVLRGASNVSDEARDAVHAAAQAIAYSPNQAARSLVKVLALDPSGFFGPLWQYLAALRDRGFVRDAALRRLQVVASVDEAFGLLGAAR